MNRKVLINIMFLSANIWVNCVIGQELPKEYQKNYDGEKIQNYVLLRSKKDGQDKVILNVNGEKILSFSRKRPLIYISSKGKAYVANATKGFNDGGGFISTEFQDIDIIDLATNKSQKADYSVVALPYDSQSMILFKRGDRYGAMNKADDIVLQPKFTSILPLNSDYKAYLAITETDYYLVDNEGKNIIGRSFVHGNKQLNANWVRGNTIVASVDGKSFGLYDYVAKKELVPYQYDNISPLSGSYYQVIKGKISGVYDTRTKSMVLPFSLGISYVHSVISSPLDSSDYFIVSLDRNGKSLENIIHHGNLLVEDKYELENISYKNFPFIGGYNTEGKYYIFDLSQPKMLINGLPYVEGMTRIEYLDEKPGFVRVQSVIDPKVTRGDNRDWVMVLNTEGKILSGYRAAQDIARFELNGGNPIITSAYSNAEGSYTANVMFGPDEPILKDLKLTDPRFKIVDNHLCIQLPRNIVNTLPSGELVSGGILLIDNTGKVTHKK